MGAPLLRSVSFISLVCLRRQFISIGCTNKLHPLGGPLCPSPRAAAAVAAAAAAAASAADAPVSVVGFAASAAAAVGAVAAAAGDLFK